MEKERVYWVDQAKALGLLVVMVVHGPLPLLLEHYFRSFSMPRFFIIAGLFLNLDKSFKEFVTSKVSRLLIPYFFFSFVSYTIWLGYRTLATDDPDALQNPLKVFLWIFYGNGGGNMVHNRPLWFLPSLFTTLLLVYFLAKIPKPTVYWVLAVTAVFGYLLMGTLAFRPPWSLDLMFTTAVLVMLGYLFRNQFLESKPLPWAILLFWTVVSIGTAFMNKFVRLSGADVGDFSLFYISAFAGTIATMDITKRLPYNRFLSYLGQHTLPIYAMHIVVYLFLYEFFRQLPSWLGTAHLSNLIDAESGAFQVVKLFVFLIFGLGIPLCLMQLYDQTKCRLALSKGRAIQEADDFTLETLSKAEPLKSS